MEVDNLEQLEPYSNKERTLCPFYGFNGMFGNFIDIKGNQCALVTNSHSPCYMEMDEKYPNWDRCRLNTIKKRSELEKVAEKVQIFPEEFWPPERSSWKGISLRTWIDYILKNS